MNGVIQSVQGRIAATTSAVPVQNPGRRVRVLVAMLLTPCVASTLFAMRDSATPPLTVAEGRPSLVFSTYMIDEGQLPVRSQPMLTPTFLFTNRGNETVRITELTPSCGCLAPVAIPMDIAPGEQGRLRLSIRTRNESAGLHEYMVTMKYEDSRPGEVALTYKVILPDKQIEIEPRVLMVMGRITAADRDIITISDHRPDRLTAPLKITGVLSSSSNFSAQLAGQSTTDGINRAVIEVTYGESIPVGQHRGVITVSTDDETYPVLQIPVILGDHRRPADESVSVSPDVGRVIVDSGHPDQSQGGVITFNIPSKWKISHIDSFPAQLVAKAVNSQPTASDRTCVTVHLSLTELPSRGIEHGNVTLCATDGDEAEMVSVPVSLSWK